VVLGASFVFDPEGIYVYIYIYPHIHIYTYIYVYIYTYIFIFKNKLLWAHEINADVITS